MSKIKYLAHPVSIEVKKKWNAKGYKVVDSKFDPRPEQEKPKPKRESKSG